MAVKRWTSLGGWGTGEIGAAFLRELDWPGIVYAGLGFSLLYAGLDQGNRLDWVQNGVVTGLLLSGGVLT